MKSKCSQATLTQENKLIAGCGENQEINAREGPGLSKPSIQVCSLKQEQYLSVNLGQRHLNWIEEGVVLTMTFEAGYHAVEHHSIQCTLDLWRALCNSSQEQGQPLWADCRLIPEVVATWNRGKGPIDIYIRLQKNCKSAHCSHCGLMVAIRLRLIMACIYNAHHSHNLSQTVSYLLSEEWKPFTDFQRCVHINSYSC